jgi:tripartite-type tricarboxylate transporter receptor subunit TctC
MLKTGAAALLAVGMSAGVALAEWPEKPVKMIVAYGAGGGTDRLARIVAEPLSKELGQPVVIDNKPGAGGTIGADAAAKADPDGYSMYMMANGHTVAAAMYAKLPYDPVGDYQGISGVASLPLVVIARPDFAANDLASMIALSKERADGLTYASVGVGSSQHFAGALLAETVGANMVHIPYQKTPEALAAVLSGEVDMLVEVVSPVLGQIKAGDVKALVLTSANRHPALPDLGTVAEAGFADYDVSTWYGLVFPKGTPADIAAKASNAVAKALQSEEIKSKTASSGYVLAGTSPEEMSARVASEVARWSKVREKAGIPQR